LTHCFRQPILCPVVENDDVLSIMLGIMRANEKLDQILEILGGDDEEEEVDDHT